MRTPRTAHGAIRYLRQQAAPPLRRRGRGHVEPTATEEMRRELRALGGCRALHGEGILVGIVGGLLRRAVSHEVDNGERGADKEELQQVVVQRRKVPQQVNVTRAEDDCAAARGEDGHRDRARAREAAVGIRARRLRRIAAPSNGLAGSYSEQRATHLHTFLRCAARSRRQICRPQSCGAAAGSSGCGSCRRGIERCSCQCGFRHTAPTGAWRRQQRCAGNCKRNRPCLQAPSASLPASVSEKRNCYISTTESFIEL